MSIQPVLRGYAIRIKTAVHNHDRNDLTKLDSQLLISQFNVPLASMLMYLAEHYLLTPAELRKAQSLTAPTNSQTK